MRLRTGLLCAILATVCVACDTNDDVNETTYIPSAPDYTDSDLWYSSLDDNDNTGADIFYIVSTWEFDWYTGDGRICHYADANNQTHRDDMAKEISKIAGFMGIGNNFYSPYYRHITLEAWVTDNEDTINNRFNAVTKYDIQNAFDYFIDSLNNDRPFVLAGFSQGGKSVVELIKTMSDDVRERMVAAYVLGYKVTPDDTTMCKSFKAAKDSVDFGVTICYNSVSDVKYIKSSVSKPCAMCINPVNWRTDATPATLYDTITVTLSPEYNVLVLDGYSGSEYSVILDYFNKGDFHSAEPWLYSECLAKNIRQRIDAYRRK